MDGELLRCAKRENAVLYKGAVYYFSSEELVDRYINFVGDEESEEGFPESFNPVSEDIPHRLSQHEMGLVKPHEAELLCKCPVTIDKTNKIVEGHAMRSAVFGSAPIGAKDKVILKKYFFTSEEALKDYLKKSHVYNKVQIPVKEPPEVTELDDTKIDNLERQIGDLENAMGPTLPKALVELGRKDLASSA